MVDWLKALPSQAEDICCTSLDVADFVPSYPCHLLITVQSSFLGCLFEPERRVVSKLCKIRCEQLLLRTGTSVSLDGLNSSSYIHFH